MKRLGKTSSLEKVVNLIQENDYRIVIVEGYDCVGKGRVINYLRQRLPDNYYYRPPYHTWAKLVDKTSRWAICATMMEMFQTFGYPFHTLILDRGSVCGAVYHPTEALKETLPNIFDGLSIFHILVVTDEFSFTQFQTVRNSKEILKYEDCLEITNRYQQCLEELDHPYIIFQSFYEDSYAELSKRTCQGCGHYADGICVNCHSLYFKQVVPPNQKRCNKSSKKEAQDE